MENTRRQQAAADGLVTAAVLLLGTVLVVAGSALARDLAPGASGRWLRIAPRAFDAERPPAVDVLLGLVASLVGLAVVVWWLLSMALALASALLAAAGLGTASRWTGSFAPAFMRRLALAALGLSLVSVPAAHADGLPDPAWHSTAVATGSAGANAPEGAEFPATSPREGAGHLQATPSPLAPVAPTLQTLQTSETPVPALPTAPAVAPRVASAVPEAAWVPAAPPTEPGVLVQQPLRTPGEPSTVEVRPGDSLWAIVARHLGPGATDLDIAMAWPSWYQANAGTIGDSPDLIRPGQLLVPPR